MFPVPEESYRTLRYFFASVKRSAYRKKFLLIFYE